MFKNKFRLPIYGGTIFVLITNSLKKIKCKYNLQGSVSGCDAFAFHKNGKYYICLHIKQLNQRVISHEIVHTVNYIFSDKHIELDLNNDEPQAYLHCFITEKVNKIVKKYKKQIKC